MSVRSGQSVTTEFTTRAFATGAATNATGTPTGTLYVNGTADAASVTVTNQTTGVYKAAVTLPTLAVGDVVSLVINATVSGVTDNAKIWEDSKDVFAGAIPDVAAGGSGGILISGSNSGTTTLGALTVSGATTLAALSCTTLTASGAVAFQSTFATTGTTTFNAFTVTNATTLSGSVSLGSTLGVTGTTTLAAVNTGSVGITGTLSTSGTTTLNAFTITNALTVSGATTLTGAVTATNVSNNITGVHADVTSINSVATSSVTAVNANVGTTQPVNFTGTAGSALVKTDMVDIAGAAVSTSTAQLGVNVVNVNGSASAGAAGYVGIDWSAINAPTTTQNLSGTTIATVTNQLTAAAIATGVWQDATAGDFTTANSIGKSLYTAGVVPGGSGGLLISGSNTGTTTFGALTVTGATTFTGAWTATNAGNSITGIAATVAGTVTANVTQIAGQTANAAAAVTFPATVASPTNITAGTITTVSGNVDGSVGSVVGTVNANLTEIATHPVAVDTGTAGTISFLSGEYVATTGSTLQANVVQWQSENVQSSNDGIPVVSALNYYDSGLTAYASYPANFGTLAITATGTTGINWGNVENPDATVDLSNTTIKSVTDPIAGGTDLTSILGTAITEGAAGRLAGSFSTLLNVATPVLTVASVNQTGDSFARIGATGSGLTSLAPSSTALSTVQWTNALATDIGTTNTTVATNLDAAVSSRSTLTQTQVTGGAYSIQSASCVLGDTRIANLDATVSSRMATYTQPTGFLAATFPATVASPTNITAGTITTVSGNVTGTVGSIASPGNIWDVTLSSHLTAGSTGAALNSASSSGDPWATDIPGAYTAGQAGYILGNGVPLADDALTANAIATSGANRIADTTRRRTQANVEASSYGDTLSLTSLYGFIQQAQESNTTATAGVLTIYLVDGSTVLGTRTISTNAAAEPVTGVS